MRTACFGTAENNVLHRLTAKTFSRLLTQYPSYRVRNVTLTLKGDKKIARTSGEILFTDYGISGIAAMELAAAAQKYIDNVKRNPFTCIDFMPDMSYNEIVDYLLNLNKIKGFTSIDNLLTGFLPKQILQKP